MPKDHHNVAHTCDCEALRARVAELEAGYGVLTMALADTTRERNALTAERDRLLAERERMSD